MNKLGYFLKNIGLLTLSKISIHIVSFFMLPIYTYLLTPDDYGMFDLMNTIISLAVPILSLCMSDAVLRFLLAGEDCKEVTITIGIKYVVLSLIIFGFLLMLGNDRGVFSYIAIHPVVVFAVYFVSIANVFLSNVARGLEKISCVAKCSFFSSVISIVCNIVFLVYFQMGLTGYIAAMIIAGIFGIVYTACKIEIWRCLKYSKNSNNDSEPEMRKYGIGLIVNSMSWWINNSLDRYVVLCCLGTSAVGMVAIASKVPLAIQAMETLIENAWILSAVKDYDKEDRDGFISTVYNVYNCILVLIVSLIVIIAKDMAEILFKGEFYQAWIMVPFYCVAMIFSGLSGICAGLIVAEKNSKILSMTTVMGAITNAVFNIVFMSLWGIIGVSIALLVSTFIVNYSRLKYLKRTIKIKFSGRINYIVYCILLFQIYILFKFNQDSFYYFVQIILFLSVIYFYRDIMLKGWNLVLKEMEHRRNRYEDSNCM